MQNESADYAPLDIEVQRNYNSFPVQNDDDYDRQDEEDTIDTTLTNNREKFLISNKSKYNLKKLIKPFWYDLDEQQKKWAIISITLLFVVWVFHSCMKERCPYKNDHDCLNSFILPRIKLWVFFILVNCCSILLQIHMLVERKTNRLYPIISLAAAVCLIILGEQTITLTEYIGGINAIHIIWLFISIQIYGVIKMWRICYQKNKRLCLLLNFFFISTSLLLFYLLFIRSGCNQWSKGINGQIDNESNPEMCRIKEPDYCWYTVVDGFQDVSRLVRPSCAAFPQTDEDSTNLFDRFFGKSVGTKRFVGFANLNKESEYYRMDVNIQQTVFNKASGYDSLTAANQAGHEVIFDREDKEYTINVKKNATLSQERLDKMADSSSKRPLVQNVLLIFIDAISRQSMHLKLPRTVSWFQNRTQQQNQQNNNQKGSRQGESYEFYRFNSLKPYTYDNLEMLLYGQIPERGNENQIKQNLDSQSKLQGIVEEFKNSGFITGHSTDICQTLSLGFDEDAAKSQKSLRYDHESYSFQCNPNYQNPESQFELVHGPYSILNRCTYGQPIADLTLDYAKSFFQAYRHEQKFMHLEYQYGHEGTGEVVRYLDEPLAEFLESMSNSGQLEDTAVIMMSDHGLHMHGLFYFMNLENVHTEVNLPGLFIHLPKSINGQFKDVLGQNQQNLISAKNIHHFLKHIINGREYANSTSSLLSPLSKQTNCKMLEIEKEDCSCF